MLPPNPPKPGPYTMSDLVNLGFTKRTIRFYIAKGVLPAAIPPRTAATYSQRHVDILLAIRASRDSNLLLADIRDRFNDPTDDEETDDAALEA